MILGVLFNIVVWGLVIKNNRLNTQLAAVPWNPQFDPDLDAFWTDPPPFKTWVACECGNTDIFYIHAKDHPYCDDCAPEWYKEQQAQESPIELTPKAEPIIGRPEDSIYADGHLLIPGCPRDIELFATLKLQAFSSHVYNSKPLNEGGFEDLKRDAFVMLHGTSKYGAEHLVKMGFDPWNFSWG